MLLFFLFITVLIINLTNSYTSPKSAITSNPPSPIRKLLRQTSRWAIASEQDKSPMISVLHANYAVGYLQALQDVAEESEINEYVDFKKFKATIYQIQDSAVKKIVQKCPQYIGNVNKELASIGINIFK